MRNTVQKRRTWKVVSIGVASPGGSRNTHARMRIPISGLSHRDSLQQRRTFMRHNGTLLAVLTLVVFLARHVQLESKEGQHKYTLQSETHKIQVTRCVGVASDSGSHQHSCKAITSLPCVMTILLSVISSCPFQRSIGPNRRHADKGVKRGHRFNLTSRSPN